MHSNIGGKAVWSGNAPGQISVKLVEIISELVETDHWSKLDQDQTRVRKPDQMDFC